MYGSTDARATPARAPVHMLALDFLTVLSVLCLWFCGTTQQLFVKDVVSVTHYGRKGVVLCPYPLFLTGTINGIASAVSFAFVLAVRAGSRLLQAPQTSSGEHEVSLGSDWTERYFTWKQLAMLLVVGVFEGIERGLQNKAFQYLGIATRTMMNSTSVLFTMAVARAAGLENVRLLKVFAMVVLVVGGCLQAVGLNKGSTSISGVVLVLASLLAGACRWALLQNIMHKSSFQDHPLDSVADSPESSPRAAAAAPAGFGGPFQTFVIDEDQPDKLKAMKPNFVTKIKMIGLMKPMDCGFCYLLSWLWERADFRAVSSELVAMWFVLGGLIVVIVLCDIIIVSRTSAVALGVVTVLAQIPMVAAGVVFNKEVVTSWQIAGFAVCLIGAFTYFRARALDGPPAPSKQPLKAALASDKQEA